MKTIRLKEGKERSLLRRHPWIFDSAIAKGGADPGETVRVESQTGQFLAWAAFSPASRIRARAWSFDEDQRIDAAFLAAACKRSVRARARFDIPSDGVRLVHGESDGLPGLIVDRYGDTLVAQFLSAGAERWSFNAPSTGCSTSAVAAARAATQPSAWPAISGSWPASTPPRSTPSRRWPRPTARPAWKPSPPAPPTRRTELAHAAKFVRAFDPLWGDTPRRLPGSRHPEILREHSTRCAGDTPRRAGCQRAPLA